MEKKEQEILISKVGKVLTWTTLRALGIEIEGHLPGRPVMEPLNKQACCICASMGERTLATVSGYLKDTHVYCMSCAQKLTQTEHGTIPAQILQIRNGRVVCLTREELDAKEQVNDLSKV